MTSKQIYIAAGGIIGIIILIGAGYFLYSSSNKQSTSEIVPQEQEEVMQTIKPEDLGLSFTARNDGKAVKFVIANIKDITSVEYEISYTAKGDIPRGAIGHVEPKNGVIETNYIDLGTCSSGRCKYDEGVTSVKLILKIAKTDGNTFSSEQTLEL